MEERLRLAESVAVAHGASDDPPQHVTAAFVRGPDTVDDQKTAGADVIGDDSERGRIDFSGAGETRCGADQIAKQIDVIVGLDALHDRRDALETGTGIHRGLGQRRQGAIGGAIVLHENQVPDLDKAIPLLIGGPRRPTRHLGTVIEEDLATRTARSGVAHGPEIRLRAHALYARRIDADLARPYLRRLVIIAVHRDPEPCRVELQSSRDEVPRQSDRLALE